MTEWRLGKKIIVLSKGRLVNLGDATGHFAVGGRCTALTDCTRGGGDIVPVGTWKTTEASREIY